MAFVPVAVPELVAQHASEASFLWIMRDAASCSPGYDLGDIGRIDERLDAHLDGLRIAGDTGWTLALEQLAEERQPGDAFVAAKVALDRGDMRGFAHLLDQVEATPELWRALPAAVAFSPFAGIERVLRAMVSRKLPAQLQAVGIAGFAAHGRDPGSTLGWALVHPDRGLRLRALQAVAAVGARPLLREVQQALGSEDLEERFWASRAAALFGDVAAAAELQRVAELAGVGGESTAAMAEEATSLAACLLEASAACRWAERLDGRGLRRLALTAAAASGAAELVPWLAACMRNQEHARRAGLACYAITGLRIEGELEGKVPDGARPEPSEDAEDDELPADPDEDLPWPDVDAVAALLSARPLGAGKLLLGQPVSASLLETVLREAPQPLRRLAAWHRCRMHPEQGIFDVAAPAWRQRALLGLGASGGAGAN